MQNKKGSLILIFIFLLFIPSALSVSVDSVLSLYQDYYGWIDLALYTLIFVGIIQELMNYRFKKGIFAGIGGGELGSGAKAVSIGLGLALAISLVTWEVKSGFYLFQIGPFILIIFLLLALLWIFGWIKSKNKSVDLGLLKKALFTLMILGIIIYFWFPSLIYNYLPWSWARTLFGIMIIIVFVILLLTLAKGGEPKETRGEPGRKWSRFLDWNKERVQSKRAYEIEKEKLAQQEKDRKQREEEKKEIEKKIKKSKKEFGVSIITIPKVSVGMGSFKRHPEYMRGGLRTFYIRAGSPLRLFAKIEGGSGNFRIDWSCMPSIPFKIEDNNTVAIIPTKELQTARDQDLIRMGKLGKIATKTNWALSRGNGLYEWTVHVKDRDFRIEAYDKVRIIVMEDIDLKKKQEEEITKSEKAGLKLDIISTLYNKKEYKNWGIYLLPLEKNVTLICKKEGNFDRIEWVIKKDKKDKGKIIGKNEEKLDYIFSEDEFKKGEYILEVHGYYKGSKKPDETDKRQIYLKKPLNIKEDIDLIALNETSNKKISPTGEEEYILEKGSRYLITLKLKEDKQDEDLKQKFSFKELGGDLGSFNNKESINNKGSINKRCEITKDKKGITLLLLEADIQPLDGIYLSEIKFEIINKYNYKEEEKLPLKINIGGYSITKATPGTPTPSPVQKPGKTQPTPSIKGIDISKINFRIVELANGRVEQAVNLLSPNDKKEMEVDINSEIHLVPSPTQYKLEWLIKPDKNLEIKDLAANKIRIKSKIEQEIIISCLIEKTISFGELKIKFKDLAKIEKSKIEKYAVLKKEFIDGGEIKNRINLILDKFEKEAMIIDNIRTTEMGGDNNIFKSYTININSPKAFESNYELFKKKLKEIQDYEKEIKDKLLDFGKYLSNENIPTEFKEFFNAFIKYNIYLTEKIKNLLDPKEWKLEKIASIVEDEDMSEVIKTINELDYITHTARRINKEEISKVEEIMNKKMEEIESTIKLVLFLKKIFPFFK